MCFGRRTHTNTRTAHQHYVSRNTRIHLSMGKSEKEKRKSEKEGNTYRNNDDNNVGGRAPSFWVCVCVCMCICTARQCQGQGRPSYRNVTYVLSLPPTLEAQKFSTNNANISLPSLSFSLFSCAFFGFLSHFACFSYGVDNIIYIVYLYTCAVRVCTICKFE